MAHLENLNNNRQLQLPRRSPHLTMKESTPLSMALKDKSKEALEREDVHCSSIFGRLLVLLMIVGTMYFIEICAFLPKAGEDAAPKLASKFLRQEQELQPELERYFDTLPQTKQTQILNYRSGEALMLNIHITHHAGTHLCGVLGHHVQPNGPTGTPSFACMGDGNNVMKGELPRDPPWLFNDTATNVEKIRPFFHFISWEFSNKRKTPLEAVDWENSNLLSIFPVKHPVDRVLSFVGKKTATILGHETEEELTHEDWWKLARGEVPSPVSEAVTNNYGLRILGDNGCCDGVNTSRIHLDHAKALIDRMTILLDVRCLNNGIEALAFLTNMTIENDANKLMQRTNHVHPPTRERIRYDDVYEYLMEKNKLEIELYEYARERSLVRCDEL